jgi:hypothetical protein
MITQYNKFINESVDNFIFNEDRLFQLISKEQSWLTYKLGLRDAIEKIWKDNNMLSPLEPSERKTFIEDLRVFYKTGIDENLIKMTLINRLPDDVKKNYNENSNIKEVIEIFLDNSFLIKNDDNTWCLVNKLNANYYDIAKILTHIIKNLINSKSNHTLGMKVYDTIMKGDTKNGLKELVLDGTGIERMILRYVGKDRDSFLKFTEHIEDQSARGAILEKEITEYLENIGIENKYSGGDGNFVDMIFGADLVVYSEKYSNFDDKKFKSIQVKTYFPWDKSKWESFLNDKVRRRYPYINWLCTKRNNDIIFIDIKTGKEVELIKK